MSKSFFLLFLVWTLHNMYIFHVKLFFVLPLQYFEKVFVCGFVILFLCCFCFVVAAFICMFSTFMAYPTSYCCHYKLMDPWVVSWCPLCSLCFYTSPTIQLLRVRVTLRPMVVSQSVRLSWR